MAYIDWEKVSFPFVLDDKKEEEEKELRRPPAEGTYIMYNQSRKQEWPKLREGHFSQTMALTPNARIIYGHVEQSHWYQMPFAIIEASRPLPLADRGTITTYRRAQRSRKPWHLHYGRSRTIPVAAYCWSPNKFPQYLDTRNNTFSLADFVAAEAMFVVEALLAIVRYLDVEVPRGVDKRSYRIRHGVKKQIFKILRPKRDSTCTKIPFGRMESKAGVKSYRHRTGHGYRETEDQGSQASHETTRIYVTGLPGPMTNGEVERRFSICGVVLGCHIIRHKGSSNGQVHVIVRYADHVSALRAMYTPWGGTINVRLAKHNAKWEGPD